MEDRSTVALFIVMVIAVIALSFALAIWIMLKLAKQANQPMSATAAGGSIVPVRGLKRSYKYFGHAQNSISPRLEITPSGLQFKLFKPDYWPFTAITQVDAPWMMFTTRIAIRSRDSGRLYVDFAGKDRAQAFLRTLTPHVPLTQRAIDMRDGPH